MRYVGLIETTVRGEVGSTIYTTSAGIQSSLILQAINDAQERLQSVLVDGIPDLQIFDSSQVENIVAAQSEYDLENDVFMNCILRKVEYSHDGATSNYFPLRPTTRAFIDNNTVAYPCSYTNANKKLIIGGTPQSALGKLRITYVRALDKLEKRRGTVSSTPNDGTNYTSIVLASDIYLDNDAISADENLCVNDRDGNVIYYNIPYTSYVSATRTITLGSGVLMSVGTILAGHYITIGKYTTTHSKLHRNCERYLIAFAKRRVQAKKSDTDISDTNPEMTAIEEDIMNVLSRTIIATKSIPRPNSYWR